MRKRRTASSSAVREFRARSSNENAGLFAYELDLLQNFARNSVNASFLLPVFVAGVAAIGAQWHGWFAASLWGTAAICSYLILGLLSRYFLQKPRKQEELQNWRIILLAAQGIVALVWTALALTDCATCSGAEYSIIHFSVILIFQASTFMLAYTMISGALIMILPASLTLSIRYIATYEAAHVIMGATLILATLFFLSMAMRFKKSAVSMLESKTIREMLIVELETEKSISEAARSRAEEANLAKSRFLATMSHELRTPLNAILGFSEIMREEMMGPMDNEQYKEYVGDIHNSGSHLLKLINEILDISRIEAGKHNLKEAKLKLVSVVEDARHMMNVKAAQKGITLKTKYEDNLRKVWVDERAIRQITLNLLSNALKFTPTGGAITVKVGWTAKGGQYIAVTDTGPGIPEAEIPIVLSSFGQGSIAIQHAEQGTGLGLTIVQALLHMHQGHFELKSRLREGTEAIAYLPRERVLSNGDLPPKTSDNAPNFEAKVA